MDGAGVRHLMGPGLVSGRCAARSFGEAHRLGVCVQTIACFLVTSPFLDLTSVACSWVIGFVGK